MSSSVRRMGEENDRTCRDERSCRSKDGWRGTFPLYVAAMSIASLDSHRVQLTVLSH